MKRRINILVSILVDTGKKFTEDRATRLAAGLAYYTLFSLAPLLIILTGIAGQVLDEAAATEAIPEFVEQVVGPNAADWIVGLIENSDMLTAASSFTVATIISIGIMIWGAANIFNHLKETLNFIWGVRTAPGRRGIIANIRGRVFAFVTVFFVGILVVGFFLLNTVVAYMIPRLENFILESTFLRDIFPRAVQTFTETILPTWRVVQFVQFFLAFALMAIVFALFYKFMPDVNIEWRDVWVGAAFTAFLITIGNLGLSIYFQLSTIGSLYGAAGSIMVVLFWFYYSAQMFLFGAEFTEVYSRQYGSEIRPSDNAIAFNLVFGDGAEGTQSDPYVAGGEGNQIPGRRVREI